MGAIGDWQGISQHSEIVADIIIVSQLLMRSTASKNDILMRDRRSTARIIENV